MTVQLAACALLSARASGESNTVVRFQIQRGTNSLGAMDVELFDSEKPQTVSNFLLYVHSGAYSNVLFHRCLPGFALQGGGFAVTNPIGSELFLNYQTVSNYGRLTNEFSIGSRLSNTFGTIAMAKVGGDPNSATSQWFFNLGNNATNLDQQNGGFTVFGRVLESTNVAEGTNILRHFNSLATNAGIVNLASLLGSAYSVFSDLPVAFTNGARIPANRELYYAQISVVGETNLPGLFPPSITITNAPNLRLTNTAVVIGGAASDDTGVARVVYRLQNGPLEIATGTTNWMVRLTPLAGTNTLTAQSIDREGNFSTNTAAVTFVYVAKMPLNLRVVGNGKVAGATSGMSILAGRYYTVTATPGKNQVFDGWSGSVTSATPTLTFLVPADATNFTLTATFSENPFVYRAGTYVGLFRPTNSLALENVGQMTVTLANNGAFSGKIVHRDGTYRFAQAFDRSGSTFLQGNVGAASRFFTLLIDTTNRTEVITGSAGTDQEIRLERTVGALPATNPPPTGTYTLVLPPPAPESPSQLIPGGQGFGTGSLERSGLLNLSGTLGDGTPFKTSATMTRLQRWPLHVVLFGGRGILAGWINAPTNQTGSLTGRVSWIKAQGASLTTYPAGFSNNVELLAAPFKTPAKGVRAMNWITGLAEITGAEVLDGVTNQVKLTTTNTFTFLDSNAAALKLTFDTKTASVQGSFIHPGTGATNRLRGVVFQGDHGIHGQFVEGDQTGSLAVRRASFLQARSITNLSQAGLVEALKEGGWLRFASSGTIALTNALVVPYDTRLDADGNNIVISGGGQTRLFEVRAGVYFAANNLTFADGRHVGAKGSTAPVAKPGADGCGAGILNLGGVVALTNCVLTNFIVRGGDAGDVASNNTNGLPGGRGLGAAICNQGGLVTLQSCLLADNLAVGGKGNADATGQFSNRRGAALGGAVASDGGGLEVRDSLFLRNQVQGGESRLQRSGYFTRGGESAGGAIAILGGQLRLVDSQCRSNAATGAWNASSTLGGGGSRGGAIFLETNVTAIVERSAFAANAVTGSLSRPGVQSGGGDGGALFNLGALNLQTSSFEQNLARGGGGTVAGDGCGGAVTSFGSLVIQACTFNDNLAQGGDGAESGVTNAAGGRGLGGAICAGGGTFAATNSTLAYNRVYGGSGSSLTHPGPRGDGLGGALAIVSNSAVLVHLTLAFNQAGPGTSGDTNSGAASGGGIYIHTNGNLGLRGVLLASNSPGNVSGAFTDSGYCLSSDDAAGFTAVGSRTNLDPQLGLLTANGGATQTMATRAGSPARDYVPSSFPPVDQRGVSRPQPAFGSADIGAYESDGEQDPPSFVTLPAGAVLRFGTNFTLSAEARGGQPVRYYWLKNGNPVPNATNATFGFTNLQPVDAGDYRVVATNRFGVTTGSVASITVDSRPLLLQQPNDRTVSPGGSAAFAVAVDGPMLNYRWWHNNILVPGATNATLTVAGALAGDQGGYQVIVTNFAGAVTSRVATLTFDVHALEILDQPDGVVAAEGGSASFNVLVAGVPPFSYQWFHQNNPLAGATNNFLTVPVVGLTNAGNYTVTVTNAYTSLTSTPALLSVEIAPVLTIVADATNVFVTCLGAPLRVHRLLAATNLAPGSSWTPVATNQLLSNGKYVWVFPRPTNAPALYRAVVP